jgi:hypothetical protein
LPRQFLTFGREIIHRSCIVPLVSFDSQKTTIRMNTRRHFLRQCAISLSVPLTLGSQAFAQATPPQEKLKEDDPMALALGYKEDSTKVDATKFPQHKNEHVCKACALIPSLPAGDYIPCPAFANKLVNQNGWCAAFAKKPA